MLSKVIIYSGLNAQACEVAINDAIEEYAGYDISYEMMIEQNISIGEYTDTRYTLLINIENLEGEE